MNDEFKEALEEDRKRLRNCARCEASRDLLKSIRDRLDSEFATLPCEASVYRMDDDQWGELMIMRDEIDLFLKAHNK